MIEESLVALLLGYAPLATVVGNRIYWVKAPDHVQAPYIILSIVSAPREYVMEGPTGGRQTRVQADCWNKTYLAAKQVARALESRLSGFIGTQGTTVIDGAFLDAERESFDDDDTPSDLFGVSCDYLIWHKEITP